ncbi:MAG TPA: alpha-hydroxy acid oxidase [Candidatus Acidoferrales bacterium]|nr:alpha-hydroxy acid oxidase [Candidatus Acidoferrales bacterium]
MPRESLVELLARHEAAAAAALPLPIFDFIAGGGGEEISMREASAAWRAFRLRPRALRDVSTVDTSTSVCGAHLSVPVMVAPTAYHAVAHPEAEVETARGVNAAAGFMVVATRASAELEQIVLALDSPWWFQVYVMRDRDITVSLVQRATQLGATALVLTGDTPTISRRRHSASLPPMTMEQYLGNAAAYVKPGADIAADTNLDPSITFESIQWLRDISGLPVLVKGVLRPDDAIACIDAGAAGVIVSNHGGRQLDRVVSTAAALADVADAVGARSEVLVDGGIRTGIDVLVALALGARAVLVGRPVCWALAAEGAQGVQLLLEMLRGEFIEAMTLAGAASVAAIDRTLVVSPD